MRVDRFQYWIDLQASGRDHITRYHDDLLDKDVFVVEKVIAAKIREWYHINYYNQYKQLF